MSRFRNLRFSGFSSALVLSGVLTLAACNEGGEVSPDLLGIIQPKPAPSSEPSPEPSSSPDPTPTPTADATALYTGPAEVSKYVAKFVADGLIQGVDVTPDMSGPKLSIRIASLDSYGSSVIGLCETSSNLRRITFDPDFWYSVSETQREILAHHELGHCVLFRGHRTSVLSSGIYASIMYPQIMKSSTYTNNYDYYQDELFQYAATDASLAMVSEDPNQISVHVCDDSELSAIAAGGAR